MIAAGAARDQGARGALLNRDAVVRRYRAVCAHLDGTVMPEHAPGGPPPGVCPPVTHGCVRTQNRW